MSLLERMEASLGPVKIGLRKDIVFTRQLLWGGVRYVGHDPVTFQNHAFTKFEYQILAAVVPSRSLAETFDHLVGQGALEEAHKEDFYTFVMQLHGINLLHLPINDPSILFERFERRQAAQKTSLAKKAVYHKVPMFDPQGFLKRAMRFVAPLFSRTGLAFWLVLNFIAVWSCWGRFGELFGGAGSLLELSNIPVLFITLVVLKVIHEFGHAFACKKFGGEVPEMGLVFILGAPCAYVDASASWKFPHRWQRVVVAMGGMYVESIVAAIFAIIWAGTPGGFMHDLAMNVLMLAGVVTVLFNINPLMRFDGYFVLSDLLGTPNLVERSTRFMREQAKTRIVGLKVDPMETTPRERRIYMSYGIAAFFYKISLAIGICSIVILSWPMVGMIFGATLVWSMMVQPIVKVIHYLLYDEEVAPNRRRARRLAGALAVAAPCLLLFLPVSFNVAAPSVLEPEKSIVVHAPNHGFVSQVVARVGDRVEEGQSLVILDYPELSGERDLVHKQLLAERARLQAVELTDPIEAKVHRAKLAVLQARLAEVSTRLACMNATAGRQGRVVRLPRSPGAFVMRGEELAEIHAGAPMLRLVLDGQQVSRCKLRVGSRVEVRWATRPDRVCFATIRRILPSASRDNIPEQLTVLAGGEVFGTRDDDGLRADRPYLHLLLEPNEVPLSQTSGLTARVTIPASWETCASWVRRQLTSFYHSWRIG